MLVTIKKEQIPWQCLFYSAFYILTLFRRLLKLSYLVQLSKLIKTLNKDLDQKENDWIRKKIGQWKEDSYWILNALMLFVKDYQAGTTHNLSWIILFSFVYTILLYSSVRRITYLNNPTTTKTWCYLLFEIWLANFVFLLVCLFET